MCNNLDDDCDGVIDNGNPDGGASCDATATGECAKGTLTCIGGSLQCVAAMPIPEACDGLDNNCDGAIDEGDPGGGLACPSGMPGACGPGTTKCDSPNGIVCEPNITPGQLSESCNGIDDDCNGTTDEGNPEGGGPCQANATGECKNGTLACENGSLQCKPGMPSNDICDGLDNNCNGAADEGNPGGGQQCMTGLPGVCAQGVTQCGGVLGITCNIVIAPGMLPEACNALDDDCDGSTDEDIAQVGQPCVAMGYVGICQFGTFVCPAGSPTQLTCDHPLPSTIQESCNGKDDDCNGTIDDPSLLNGFPCATGLPGVCSSGTTLCNGGNPTCTPGISPNTQTEICDSLDNNCNGQTDEMNPTPACTAQNPNAGFVQTWVCTAGTCEIAVCQSGYANINTAPGDGCECSTDSWANSCGVSSSLAVPSGGSASMMGKIESAAGSDWVTFNFSVPGVGQSYHPKIELTDSAGGQYAMDVMVDCAGNAAGCSTTGGANNESGISVNVWEQNYNGYVPGPGCCGDNTPRAGSVKVRVYRKFGDTPTCASYTVTATNL